MIDLVYFGWNRLEFTKRTFQTLLTNTNLDLVARLIVYDDGSTDGTDDFLLHALERMNPRPETHFRVTKRIGPVALLADYLQRGGTDVFARIDNDTMVPPGWLGECLGLMESNSFVDLLGIEARSEASPSGTPPRKLLHTQYIGGIGVMRRRAFNVSMPAPLPGSNDNWRESTTETLSRFGFEEWQQQKGRIHKAWIDPPLPVCLLNRVPFEPWSSLSSEYVARGWQRDWPEPYLPARSDLWEWWA